MSLIMKPPSLIPLSCVGEPLPRFGMGLPRRPLPKAPMEVKLCSSDM